MTEFLHLQKLGKKVQSTAWSSQILQHLEQFLKNWFLHSKLSNSTSTPALLFYKSTTFFSPNSTFYNFFLWKFYIYKHPKFLQFYNIFLAIFYILQWFFGPNLQSTFTPPSPLLYCYHSDQLLFYWYHSDQLRLYCFHSDQLLLN